MKKVISILLVIIMLFTMVPATAFATDGITVNLVSFMRGDVTELRSSELLEVQVEGYNGSVSELTYKWTSSLGTYLYIYNSHNMYGINNTAGEIEIYNSAKTVKVDKKDVAMSGSKSMEGRTYDKTYSGVGFAWAAVYGADLTNNSLKGTVTVEVFDKKGNKLGSDSFTDFKTHDLQSDLENVVIGIFEGDKINVLDLLGKSGVVHITCTASSVSSAEVKSGGQYIEVIEEKIDRNTYNYHVKGIKAGTNAEKGDAQLEIKIAKQYCKFHAYKSGTANPVVYVFKKPTTSTTTTTLTLVDNIDNRCDYFINGVQGTEIDKDGDDIVDIVIFENLTPNTTYTVDVRASYKDGNVTKYAYGYVEDTTKPVYKATVKTYLDNEIKDISAIHGEDVTLHLSKDGKTFIDLTKTATGTYEAAVEPGTYFPWHYENGDYHQARNYELIIENANAELRLHHYSVKYDTNGGAFKSGEEVGTEIYSSMSAVNATSNIPVRDGYVFAGWEYDKATYASGALVTSSITAPVVLKAKWEKAVNVTINVTIDHKTVDGFDPNPTRADLDVDFLEKTVNSPAFVETGDKLSFRTDKVTDKEGNEKAYTYSIENNISTYTATDFTYTGLLESSTFGVALSKSGYDVGAIEKKQDKLGNWVINIPLTYNPDDFDLDFSVEMADDVPTDLYPDAVIVKIAYWNTETNEWKIISQQETVGAVVKPGVRVDIDKSTGEGSGSYPVWRFDGENNAYGYRAVVTGFIYKDSTIVVPTEKDHTKDDNTVIVTYTDGNYTATMSDIADGKKFSTSLNGAYYNEETNAQQGTLHGVISVEKYNVTFDAQGGTVNGKDKDIAEGQYYVPEFINYQPVMEGHKFLGWYKDSACTIPATEGELLVKNITLYASWDQILTGNVRVAGYYLQNGSNVKVWEVDRATSAVVALQEITADGVYNIDRKTVAINWPKADEVYGMSEEYRFEGLDPLKTYRVEILVLNYGTIYQNSTTEFVLDDNFADDYNADDFEAVYPETSKWETFVNAYLSFEPASYFQPVEVDASLIGEKDLRPKSTLVQVWYKATGTDNAYQVISQHTVVPYGIEVGMGADGKDDADYGYYVWNSLYNGALYDYQAHLEKINNQDVSQWPVSVVYGAPSRYSPLHNAPTGVLKVKIIPNTYSIIFNEIYESEDVSVVSYGAHTWSYETAIDYVPVRDGYAFEGWYSNPECTGEKVTAIAETVAEDTELYAKWKRLTTPVEPLDSVSYIVEHHKENTDGTYSIAEEDTEILSGKIGATVIATAKTYEGYCFNEAQSEATASGVLKAISSADDILTLKLYYDIDNAGGGENGDEGDGIADKYQKKVIFKVVNGIWADGTTVDKVVYLELMKDGEYAVDGTASLVAPAGMVANEGYKNGSWNAEIPSTVSGTETLTFTYSFVRSTTPVEPLEEVSYIVEYYKDDVLEETEIFKGKIGDDVTATIKDYEGYDYNEGKSTISGTLVKITSDEDVVVLKVYYDKSENIGGGDTPTDPDTPVDPNPEDPTDPDTPVDPKPEDPTDPDVPGGEGEGNGNGSLNGGSHHILFGKTDGIGWYNVSKDGGQTWNIVFGNSTYEVEHGTEIIVKIGDIMGDTFTFYVNGKKYYPDENGQLVITVNGYMLIGALSVVPEIDFEVPDVEESLNWFQKIIKAIKDFFAMIGSWFK